MSLLVDILIVLVLIGCLVHGFRRGLVGSVGSIAGFAAGAVAAGFAAPRVGAIVADPTGRLALGLVTALVLLLVGAAVGSSIGSVLGRPLRLSPLRPLRPVDRVLGAAIQLLTGALVVPVLASLAIAFGGAAVSEPVSGSVVVPQIAASTPRPLTTAVAGIRSTVVAEGTKVFELGDRGRPQTVDPALR